MLFSGSFTNDMSSIIVIEFKGLCAVAGIELLHRAFSHRNLKW